MPPEQRAAAGATEDGQAASRLVLLRAVQAVVAVGLLLLPVVLGPLPGPVLAKDLLVGGVLLAGTVVAAAAPPLARLDGPLCLGLGVLLVLAALLLEAGAGPQAALSQWLEVGAGVLLIGAWAGRSP